MYASNTTPSRHDHTMVMKEKERCPKGNPNNKPMQQRDCHGAPAFSGNKTVLQSRIHTTIPMMYLRLDGKWCRWPHLQLQPKVRRCTKGNGHGIFNHTTWHQASLWLGSPVKCTLLPYSKIKINSCRIFTQNEDDGLPYELMERYTELSQHYDRTG